MTRMDRRTLALGTDLPPEVALAVLRAQRDKDLHS